MHFPEWQVNLSANCYMHSTICSLPPHVLTLTVNFPLKAASVYNKKYRCRTSNQIGNVQHPTCSELLDDMPDNITSNDLYMYPSFPLK